MCFGLHRKANTLAVAPEAWSPVLQEATKIGDLKIVPFDVTIDYKLWSYGELSFFSCVKHGACN